MTGMGCVAFLGRMSFGSSRFSCGWGCRPGEGVLGHRHPDFAVLEVQQGGCRQSDSGGGSSFSRPDQHGVVVCSRRTDRGCAGCRLDPCAVGSLNATIGQPEDLVHTRAGAVVHPRVERGHAQVLGLLQHVSALPWLAGELALLHRHRRFGAEKEPLKTTTGLTGRGRFHCLT